MKRHCVSYVRIKKYYGSFYEDKWFLDSGTFAYFTLFKSNFIDMTISNYDWVKTVNSKVSLFIVACSTVLIGYEIFDSEKETIRVTISKLYYVSSIQIYFLSTEQILQSELRVENDKSSSTFCDKFGNAILSATPNLWDNI